MLQISTQKEALLILLEVFFSVYPGKWRLRLCSHNFPPVSIYYLLIILLIDAIVFELLTQLLNLLAISI